MKTCVSRRTVLGAMAVAALAACSAPATPRPARAIDPNAPRVVLEIGSIGDSLRYDVTELSAPAGSRILLRLKNNANPKIEMLHNWVLTEPGAEDAVANDGVAAGPRNSYVKESDPRVIVLTKLIRGGETTEVEFMAPPPGVYPFVCTFPGHPALMRGKLTIR